jgi:DNA-directed RNA polymerase II subunit RPB2
LYAFRIYTDPGRCQRPLFIVENNKLKLLKAHIRRMNLPPPADPYLDESENDRLTFEGTLQEGLIEFLDVEEEETSMIAMNIEDLSNFILQ